MSTFEQRFFSAINPKRGPIRKRGGAKRKGANLPYSLWMHTHPCLVAGAGSPCSGSITMHHVRHIVHPDGTIERTGRRDRRTLALCEGHHQNGKGPHAIHTLTADHGRAWERFFGVDIEAAIKRYNAEFDALYRGIYRRESNPEGECSCRFSGDTADAGDCPLHGVSRQPAVRLVMEEGNVCPF